MTGLATTVAAGFARRASALALDASLLLVVFMALNLLLYKAGALEALRAGTQAPLLAPWGRVDVVLGAVLALGVTVLVLWRVQGATPGGLLMGVRLVRARDGARPGWPRLALRLLLVALLGGAGLPWCIGGRAALHDRWSGTRAVLEDESLGLPGFDRGLGAP